jgi:hypothetical protein
LKHERLYGTVFVPDKWLVDDVLIIDIQVELKMMHIQLKNVYHRDKAVRIGRRS